MNKASISIYLIIAVATCVALGVSLPRLNLDANADQVIVSGDTVTNTPETTQKKGTYVRTENYPRPPYSGATYFIYERDDKVICTKLAVCNKFNDCTTTYKKGIFKEQVDIDTGEPYGKTDGVAIAANKLKKHVCLTKYKLIP